VAGTISAAGRRGKAARGGQLTDELAASQPALRIFNARGRSNSAAIRFWEGPHMREPVVSPAGPGEGELTRRALWLSGLGAVGLGLPGLSFGQPAPPAGPTNLPPPLADYHMHIQGQALTEALERWKARDPNTFKFSKPGTMTSRSGADALKVLDAAGIRYGVLLSAAYTFGSPLLAPDHSDVARLTRIENAYNIAEAKRSGGRLVASISVNPLSPTAAREIDYWSRRGAAGLKLHLANSLFDFGAPDHIQALKQIFALAGRHRLPITIHLRNRFPWGAAQVNTFVDQVLPAAGGVTVQVAHGAGWAGLDEPTLEALQAFSQAIAANRPGTQALTFDLALVLGTYTRPEQAARYVEVMRSVGLHRFVFASDWPAAYTPAEQVTWLEKALPLTPDEWRTILAHRASYFKDTGRSAARA
jgi:predicted TIM-barrel fold metal-dependent hydrolase